METWDDVIQGRAMLLKKFSEEYATFWKDSGGEEKDQHCSACCCVGGGTVVYTAHT